MVHVLYTGVLCGHVFGFEFAVNCMLTSILPFYAGSSAAINWAIILVWSRDRPQWHNPLFLDRQNHWLLEWFLKYTEKSVNTVHDVIKSNDTRKITTRNTSGDFIKSAIFIFLFWLGSIFLPKFFYYGISGESRVVTCPLNVFRYIFHYYVRMEIDIINLSCVTV